MREPILWIAFVIIGSLSLRLVAIAIDAWDDPSHPFWKALIALTLGFTLASLIIDLSKRDRHGGPDGGMAQCPEPKP
jgi:hypothetical protein